MLHREQEVMQSFHTGSPFFNSPYLFFIFIITKELQELSFEISYNVYVFLLLLNDGSLCTVRHLTPGTLRHPRDERAKIREQALFMTRRQVCGGDVESIWWWLRVAFSASCPFLPKLLPSSPLP